MLFMRDRPLEGAAVREHGGRQVSPPSGGDGGAMGFSPPILNWL